MLQKPDHKFLGQPRLARNKCFLRGVESFLDSFIGFDKSFLVTTKKNSSQRETKRMEYWGQRARKNGAPAPRMLMHLSTLINGPLIIWNEPIRKMVLFQSIVSNSSNLAFIKLLDMKRT